MEEENTKGGTIVETKQGIGKTKNSDSLINGKVPVYLDNGKKIICSKENLVLIGFWD